MNIKRIFAAAALCIATLLSGCDASESGESESRSSSRAQSELPAVSAQSTAETSSSAAASSSIEAPSAAESFPRQKQFEGTDDYGELVEFLESHPNAVIVNIEDTEDTTNPEVYEHIGTGFSVIKIPYAEFSERLSEIPSDRPVVVCGMVPQAIIACDELLERRTDIPEVMYFYWFPLQMPG